MSGCRILKVSEGWWVKASIGVRGIVPMREEMSGEKLYWILNSVGTPLFAGLAYSRLLVEMEDLDCT
jgi:hypothetical protein